MTTRFRSSGEFSTVTVPRNWRMYLCTANCCSASQVMGWQAQTPATDSDYIGTRKSMNDVVIENFRKRSEAGEIFMNEMSSVKRTLNPAEYSGLVDYYTNAWVCGSGSAYRYKSRVEIPASHALYGLTTGLVPDGNSSWGIPTSFTYDEMENLIDEANTKCLDARGRSKSNLFETIAERREAYRLLSSYSSSARKAVSALSYATSGGKKVLKPLNSIAQAAMEAHLITQYGLKPVVSDIKYVLNALENMAPSEKIRQTTRGSAINGKSSMKLVPINFSSNYSVNVLQTVTEEYEARAMSLDEYSLTIAQQFGLTAKGFITLPWELITLSFVADWFVNVGNYIGAYVPSPHYDQLGSCITLTRRASLTNTLGVPTPIGIATINSFPSGSKTGTVIEVSRFPGLRAPRLLLRNDFGLNPELQRDWSRLADSFALTGVRLKGIAGDLSHAWQSRHVLTS